MRAPQHRPALGVSGRGALLVGIALASIACTGAAPLDGRDGGAPVLGPDAELIGCRAYDSIALVEQNIILPKCGRAGDGACHASGNVAPRMAEIGAIARNVLDVPGVMSCHLDKLVSREAPEQSYLLAKIRAKGSAVTCSNGEKGGSKMPYQDAPQLTPEEIDCLRWWVHRIVE